MLNIYFTDDQTQLYDEREKKILKLISDDVKRYEIIFNKLKNIAWIKII